MMDKVVWITGASSGIGEALSHAFSDEGALLVLSARREEELERVRNNISINRDKHLIVPLDVTEITQSNNAVQRVINHFGRIDIVVHNAGISNRSFIKDTQFSVFERVMEVNYFGAVGLTKAVLPHMIEQQSGHFVVVSSLTGKFSSPK
jgi:NADP-dependent 3-hydroxy acid dehydrogenase YdfG